MRWYEKILMKYWSVKTHKIECILRFNHLRYSLPQRKEQNIYTKCLKILLLKVIFILCVFHNKHTSVCNKRLKQNFLPLENLETCLILSLILACASSNLCSTLESCKQCGFHQLRDQVQSKHIHVLTGPWASSSLQLRRWAFLSTKKKSLFSVFKKKKKTNNKFKL